MKEGAYKVKNAQGPQKPRFFLTIKLASGLRWRASCG